MLLKVHYEGPYGTVVCNLGHRWRSHFQKTTVYEDVTCMACQDAVQEEVEQALVGVTVVVTSTTSKVLAARMVIDTPYGIARVLHRTELLKDRPTRVRCIVLPE